MKDISVAGRTAAQIEGAKRKAVGGRKKRCVKGKSCSATCIASNKVCLVDIPWVSAGSIPKIAKLVKSKSQLTSNSSMSERPSFKGGNLVVKGEIFYPGKKLPGSTQPTLFTDDQGNGRWVVKEGGAPGQNIAEHTANKVYKILETKLGSSGVESNLVDGKLVNKFVEGGRTLDSLSPTEMRKFNVADRVRKSHLADALVANWDYIGLVNDNMMVNKGGNLVRIDSGGTFNFRAQGGAKAFTATPMEIWTLRSGQGAQFWSNAGERDYRNLWLNQTKVIATSYNSLSKTVNDSKLPSEVKTAFNRRVESMQIVNSALTSTKLGNRTIQQLADSGTISWKSVDSALEKAFKNSTSIDPNSSKWSEELQREVTKQLKNLVG
jgi:hypothetical protein